MLEGVKRESIEIVGLRNKPRIPGRRSGALGLRLRIVDMSAMLGERRVGCPHRFGRPTEFSGGILVACVAGVWWDEAWASSLTFSMASSS